MSAEREIALIRRVSRRDRKAFEELYYLYYRRLFRFLFKFTRRIDLVEEIVNDVMFVVWQSAGNFRERSRLSTWIFGIAYRRALKRLESDRGSAGEPVPDSIEADEAEGPERRAEQRELRERLQEALGNLSAEQRAVVELTYYHGYSYPEIARIVDCPVNTVKTRMFHARRRLRKLLPAFDAGQRTNHGQGAGR